MTPALWQALSLVGHAEEVFEFLAGVRLRRCLDVLSRDAHVLDRRAEPATFFVAKKGDDMLHAVLTGAVLVATLYEGCFEGLQVLLGDLVNLKLLAGLPEQLQASLVGLVGLRRALGDVCGNRPLRSACPALILLLWSLATSGAACDCDNAVLASLPTHSHPHLPSRFSRL
jgi:hypothetical protein